MAVIGYSTTGGKMSQKLSDEEREWKSLAIARYRLLPNGLRLCIGRTAISGEQAVLEIQRETELGKLLIRVEKFYLQNIKQIDWSKYEKPNIAAEKDS